MKPKAEWGFTTTLDQVDVRRIVEEGFRAGGPRSVVRFTIDGKPYTAWREAEYPGIAGLPNHITGDHISYMPRTPSKPPGRDITGEVRISTHSRGYSDTGVRLSHGDLVEKILGVRTTVEVF